MDFRNATAIVIDLERHLGPESVHRPVVVELIADLQERTFRSTDGPQKVRLASLELRARMILNRWLKRDTN